MKTRQKKLQFQNEKILRDDATKKYLDEIFVYEL